jgi:membrane protein DedA with SNARE-associated domain
MSFPLAVLAATVGNLVGSLLAYALGATQALKRLPGLRPVLERWEGLIDRYGSRAVFIARLLPLARTFVSLPAGARRIHLAPLIAMTTIGCAIWACGFILVGLIAANAWTTINSIFGSVILLAALLVPAGSVVRNHRSR